MYRVPTFIPPLIMGMLRLSPFVFPLYFLRFKFVGLPFTALEVFIYLLFGLWFWALMKGELKWQGKGLKAVYFLSLLFLGGSILGTFFAPTEMILPGGEHINPQLMSLGILKGWVIAPLLYFLVFTQVVRSSNEVKTLLLNFVYSGALVALVSYGFGVWGEGFAGDLRLRGFFESANYLALYLVPALLLSLSFLGDFRALSLMQRQWTLFSAVILLHALLLTQSYAGILAVFGALGLYVLRLIVIHRQKARKLFWGFLTGVALLIALALTQLNSPKFQQFLDWENRSSTSVRLEIYRVSAYLIQEQPWLGVGPGLFQPYYQTRAPIVFDRVPLEWNMPHPHNIFLAFWLNSGLLGFIAFLGFLMVAHRRFTYPLVAFWGILLHGLFDVPFWKNDLAMIFWLIFGSILILQNYATPASQKRTV